MYLKRLELYGFKTFASRTTLDFEHGVTGVVGPNGSGKSNLADAVRWALGEQNVRNVRCRHAEDLIFAGTSGHGARIGARPASNMAEVLLTFDNSAGWLPVDFHEVRIGRRAYRSGENEYLLNGARVRLRDITDLLARAAISAGGHLVIGQGLIDTVLSLRPEERRTLIETLAGLRFFYSRRDDAETKLRVADTNLRNIDAMIAEAGPHLELLREQAAAYAQYHDVERELRDLLILHYASLHTQAVQRLSGLTSELATARTALEQARAAVHDADAGLVATRERARVLSRDVAALRVEVRAAHEARETAERELAVARTRREATAARLDDLRGQLPAMEVRRAEFARELARADDVARTVESERSSLLEARSPAEQQVERAAAAVAAAERSLRALAERRRDLERQDAAAAAELAGVEREDTAARAEERRLTDDERAIVEGLDEAQQTLAAARAALDAAVARAEECRAGESKTRLLSADAANRAREAEAARREAEQAAGELRAQVAGLRAWLDAMSGAGDTAPVASALVTAPETEAALAAALGPILSARTATGRLSSRDVSALLDAGARGVLTVPRAALDAETQARLEKRIAADGLPSAALIGWGDRLARVEAPDGDGRALRNALSAVLIVRDVETAWRAHATLSHPNGSAPALVVLATPSGEALLPNGLLHRPAGEGAAALERGRELRRLEAAEKGADGALQRAGAQAKQFDDESRKRSSEAEGASRALRAAESERAARRADVTAAERAVAQARREAEWASERNRRAQCAAETRARRRQEWQERQSEVRAELEALAAEEGPDATGLDAARAALQEAMHRRAEQAAALALISERMADAARRRKAADEALLHLDGDLRARRATLAQLEDEAARVATGEEALAARAAAASRKIREVHERLRPLEANLAEREAEAVRLETRLSAMRPEEERAAAAQQAAALALQRAEHDVESVTAGVRAELALDPADLPPPGPPAQGLQGRIKGLRAKLTAFGPINARAPEDLAAVSERLDFSQTQAVDLRDGIARLRALIADANATVRERYGSVAAELDAQFRVYLQQLFNGGRGELTALYDADGLPSGLEIAVQPPGKRTKELALLSGGERALVGLALVFAMLTVRPVPFCVLDEAEAALDEANTLRVGEILRGLSAQTQFIVITHNRGTMRHSNALYGVTMAESGISQVAGIRLDDVEAARQSRAVSSA